MHLSVHKNVTTQRYSVTPYAIETILRWIKSKEIAIPEIQRPFVWDATKVRKRITALMAALLGIDVLTEDYETRRIRIAFNPREERFEVANPALQKDPAWIYDIATLFSPDVKFLQLAKTYAAATPDVDENAIYEPLEKLRKIIYNHVGVIELADDLDIETVTEIFIRVNSSGVLLSQADFAIPRSL